MKAETRRCGLGWRALYLDVQSRVVVFVLQSVPLSLSSRQLLHSWAAWGAGRHSFWAKESAAFELGALGFPPGLSHPRGFDSTCCTLTLPWEFLAESVKQMAVIFQGRWEEAKAAPLAQWTATATGSSQNHPYIDERERLRITVL